jgi:hypothetical protein
MSINLEGRITLPFSSDDVSKEERIPSSRFVAVMVILFPSLSKSNPSTAEIVLLVGTALDTIWRCSDNKA